MSLFIKICGITDYEAARACVDAGVDAVGFVFADSPRRITPERAATIARSIRSHVEIVAVFRRPTETEVSAVVDTLRPDTVQADHDSLPPVPYLNHLPVYREDAEIRVGPTTRFLFEGPVSGIGRQVDLSRAAVLARGGRLILAGGLGPDNVDGAIEQVQPAGVDVSTGVESAPGVKDVDQIRRFVEAARSAQERMAAECP